MFSFYICCVICALPDVISGYRKLRVVDLTHTLGPRTAYWPGTPAFNFTTILRGQNQKTNSWFETNYFCTAEHGGTHADAPSHFYQGHWRAHEVAADKLIGPGVVINVKASVAHNPDYQVTVSDLLKWESMYNTRIPDGAIVLMNSGWTDKHPDHKLIFGTNTPSDPSTFHFPSFHIDSVHWLVKNRNVHVVGVDTPSVDYGLAQDFPNHITLGKERILGAENVANLDTIPEHGATVFVGMIKLHDGSGGPARILATFNEESGHDAGEF